ASGDAPDEPSNDSSAKNAPDLLEFAQIPDDMRARWLRLRSHPAAPPPARLRASLKTMAGAWTASHRMRALQNRRGCHYGRNARGGMARYLVCPRMFHHLTKPRGAFSTSLLDRLGLGTNQDMIGENGIQSSAARMAVACRVYHDPSGGAGAHIANFETNCDMLE
ncbi:unnamed protein product, partial [Prorocentrum cordatum]